MDMKISSMLCFLGLALCETAFGAVASDFLVRVKHGNVDWGVLPPKIVQVDQNEVPRSGTNDWSVCRHIYVDVKLVDAMDSRAVYDAIQMTNTVYYTGSWPSRRLVSGVFSGRGVEKFGLDDVKLWRREMECEFVRGLGALWPDERKKGCLAEIVHKPMSVIGSRGVMQDKYWIKSSLYVAQDGSLFAVVERYRLTDFGVSRDYIGGWGFKLADGVLNVFCRDCGDVEDVYSDCCIDLYGDGRIYIGADGLECVLTISKNAVGEYLRLVKMATQTSN